MSRLRVDPYILLLLGTVGIASLRPARGIVALGVAHAATIAIGLLFFLYGARLSTRWMVSPLLAVPCTGTQSAAEIPGSDHGASKGGTPTQR